jgi:choline-sulfatase
LLALRGHQLDDAGERESEGLLKNVLMKAGLLLSVPALVICTGSCSDPEPYSGNVLIITIDTLRPDYLSFNGYDKPVSPAMDALLSDGWYFNEALTTVPRTTPALASLFTGSYPHTNGVRTLWNPIAKTASTIADDMQRAGYQTLAVVANSILVEERRIGQGFQTYDMDGDLRLADKTTDAFLERLDGLDAGKPVFGWVHYIDPHAPYQTDPNLIALIDPDYDGRFMKNFGWNGYKGGPSGSFTPYPDEYPKSVATHRNSLPDDVNEHIRRLYAADIMNLDREVARLLAGIRSKRGEEWIIIFTSDHGESLGEHDFFFDHGDYVYNAASAIPLGFFLPDSHPLHGSGRCDGWVSVVDVAPTLYELLGMEPTAEMHSQIEGHSLVPCMRGDLLTPAPVFIESGHSFFPKLVNRRVKNDVTGRFRAIVFGDWKLIWTPHLSDDEAWEFYYLRDDPEETLDLYNASLPEVQWLKQQLTNWMEKGSMDKIGEGYSEDDVKALRSLGYIQ